MLRASWALLGHTFILNSFLKIKLNTMKTPKAIILKTNINGITSFVIVIENQSLNTVIPIQNTTIIKTNNAVLIPCDTYVFPF